MPRPMRTNIEYFQCNCHYAFAIRAISINNGVGPFCKPKTIFIGSIYTYWSPYMHTSFILIMCHHNEQLSICVFLDCVLIYA